MARRGKPGVRCPAARPISMRAGLSVAFGPDRFLPACWILVCVRVVSPVAFHSWVALHFRSWLEPQSGASQIDAGDRYPRSPELEEQISRQVAVVVATGRSPASMGSDFPGQAGPTFYP